MPDERVKRVLFPVAPAVLRWARLSAGLHDISEAAEMLRVSAPQLDAWERGRATPTLADVTRAASAFGRPLEAFLLPAPPADPAWPVDYRTVWGANVARLGPKVREQIANARELQEIAHDIAVEIGSGLDLPGIDRKRGSPALAADIRDWLGVSIEQQRSWRDRATAIEDWRAAIEGRGVLVFMVPMPPKQVRGFSLAKPSPPAIAVSSSDSENGQIFTLIHELVHVILGTDGLCIPQSGLRASASGSRAQVEQLCNDLAGLILVPTDALLTHPSTQRIAESDGDVSDGHLNRLTGFFKVSKAVMLIRLLRAGQISEDRFQVKWRQLPHWIDGAREGGGGGSGASRPELAAKRLGAGYVQLVVDGLHEGVVHPVDAARFLDIRFGELEQVDELTRGSR